MSLEWSVPRIWSGTSFIIGGGPSLKRVDLRRLTGRRVVAINSSFQDIPFADFCYFMDCHWFHDNKDKLVNFDGVKVTPCDDCKGVTWVKWLKRREPPIGLSIDTPDSICRGTNSGYGAIDLSVKLGSRRIILLGFDMRAAASDPEKDEELERILADPEVWRRLEEGEKPEDVIKIEYSSNYHKRHKRDVTPIIYRNVYMAKGKGFDSLIPPLNEVGVEVLNATEGSALKDFPFISLDEVLESC